MGNIVNSPISQSTLKRIIANSPAELPRTDALQARIRIGVGFHYKWYRSQKEHWLGWIVYQEYKALQNKRDVAAITARQRWSGLNCIPMMFWLAEAIAMEDDLLSEAENIAEIQAHEIDRDCPQHGKAIRQVLPWYLIEKNLAVAPMASTHDTEQAGLLAFAHLASKKAKYRKLEEAVKAAGLA